MVHVLNGNFLASLYVSSSQNMFVTALQYMEKHFEIADFIVPVVFFFGTVFVYIDCYLSLNTATDLLHVTALKKESITDPLMRIFNRRYNGTSIR
jgi:hypothetical protein